MSSITRQYLLPDDLWMLERVLAHGDFPQSEDLAKREARLDAARFLIAIFKGGVTSERELQSRLADRGANPISEVREIGSDIAAKTFSERFQSRPMTQHSSGGYQYGKRVEIDRSWTVYCVFTGLPARLGEWEMVGLKAKTAARALKILNSPTRPE
jgi:hypothetical protein